MGFLSPFGKEGIKGDFKIVLIKSPRPLFACLTTGKRLPKRGIRIHWYYMDPQLGGDIAHLKNILLLLNIKLAYND
jgi:hypothetical protein